MVIIDGSRGEGGGQVLRSALALSLVTGRPCRVQRIRARRAKPGLAPQHLAAVRAAAAVAGAEVRGAALGSADLTFAPGPVRPGAYHFAVGTAGSASLVLQTVLPPLLFAGAPSQLRLEGGTHNMLAPPFDFLDKAFVPLLNRLGPQVAVELVRPGFYPAGGGELRAEISPSADWRPLELLERGAARGRLARALVSALPAHVGERELRVVAHELGWSDGELRCEEVRDARGPGNVVLLELAFDALTEVVTAFGSRGVRAEQVAAAAAAEARRYLASDAPAGEHLVDQLLVPLAVGRGGVYRAIDLTPHAQTNMDVIRAFLDVDIRTQREPSGAVRIEVHR